MYQQVYQCARRWQQGRGGVLPGLDSTARRRPPVPHRLPRVFLEAHRTAAYPLYHPADWTVLLHCTAGDHLYRMDYREFVEAHRAAGADITVAALPCAEKEAEAFGLMKIDDSGK